METIIIISV